MSLAWTVVDWAAVVLATAVAGGGDGGQDVGGVGEGGGGEEGAGGEGGWWTLSPLTLNFRVDASEKNTIQQFVPNRPAEKLIREREYY